MSISITTGASVKKTTSKSRGKTAKLKIDIPVFTAAFTFKALPPVIPSFRGAVNEIVAGLENEFKDAGIAADLFHNHDEQGKNIIRYPLIQYHFTSGKIQMTGIGSGARALQLLIMNFPEMFSMNGKDIRTGDIISRKREEVLTMDDQMHPYRMYKWMALNSENYEKYEKFSRLTDRVEMLNKVLQGNLERFCTDLGLHVDRESLKSWLIDISHSSWAFFVGRKVKVFNVTFSTNLILPLNLGIGKGVSRGYGKQQPLPIRGGKKRKEKNSGS